MSISDMLNNLPSLNQMQKVGEGLSQHFERVEQHLNFLEKEVQGQLTDIALQIREIKLTLENEGRKNGTF